MSSTIMTEFYEDDLVAFSKWYAAAYTKFDPLPVRSICKTLQATKMPSPGQFPMERMLELLLLLYASASSKDILLSSS